MQSSKVLLVEDVAAQAAVARNALVGAGYRLLISRFEAEGRKRAREWKPDIVIVSSAYVRENFEAFCRELRSEIPTPFSLVIADTLSEEEFFRGRMDLRRLVDGYVQRPYSAARLGEALQGAGSATTSVPAPPPPAPEPSDPDDLLRGKAVLVIDSDQSVVSSMRDFLEPKGVEVEVANWEEAAAAGDGGRFQALVLGWPLPEGFTIEALRAVRGEGEGLPVVVLSAAAHEVVQARSPALLRMSTMLFTKPVPWKHFFRFLFRLLKQAPPAPRSRQKKAIPLPPSTDDGLRARFQEQLEAKFLEVEELKGQLRAMEETGGKAVHALELTAMREEKAALETRLGELEKKAEVESAKHQLRETELEVRLGSLIRKKTEAERRAQDLIDAGTDRAEEMGRALEEAMGELQMRDEEVTALRKDLEQALVEKESSEEKLQASLMEVEKEKESLSREREELRAEADRAAGSVEVLQAREAELLRASEESREMISRLEAELEELREEAEAKGRAAAESASVLASREKELERGEAERARLDSLLEEKEKAFADLQEKLTASEMAVAGLDEEVGVWRHRCAEAEAAMADLAAREAVLQREKEERELFPPEPPEEDRDLLLEESRKILAELEEKLAVAEKARSETASHLAAKESALEEMERKLAEKESSRAGEEALAGKEKALQELREELSAAAEERSELRKEMAAKEDALSALERKLGEEEKAREELESLLAEKEDLSARLLEEERAGKEGLEGEMERRREELAAVRGRAEEAEKLLRDADGVKASLEERVRELEGEVAAAAAAAKELEEVRAAAERAAAEKVAGLESLLEDEKLRAREAGSAAEEKEKIQQILEDVVARAQEEVIQRTRKEVELRERLKISLEEKKFLLTRMERELREAGERERRLSDLLDKALRSSNQLAAAVGEGGRQTDNLPVPVSDSPPSTFPVRPAAAVAAAAALLLVAGGWLALRDRAPSAPAPEAVVGNTDQASLPDQDRLSEQRDVWEQWTRSDVSGGVLLQATLRSPQEIAAEVAAEKSARGWSEQEAEREYETLLEPYRFEENFYFYLYLKNLEPGYPSYVDDIYAQLSLRDDQGNETDAFLPEDLEKYRRVYSFTSGDLSKSREGLTYEVTVPVAFSRAELAGKPSYIQLLAYNIGASSRRVLTWEVE